MRGILVVPALLGLVAGYAALDERSGIGTWLRLRGELAESRQRIAALREEIDRLQVQAERLESDPFAMERAIREDLERVAPGETLVRLGDVPSARFP